MGERCQYRTYVSQTYYDSGDTMCTSVSYLIACAVLGEYGMSLPPSREQMDTVMKISSILHRKLVHENNFQHRLFACMDVVNLVRHPENLILREVVGSTQRLPEDFICTFQDQNDDDCIILDIHALVASMVAKSSIVVTVNEHSTMLHHAADGNFWYFDPLVAYVMCTGDRCKTQTFIKGKLGTVAREYTGVYIKLKPTQ